MRKLQYIFIVIALAIGCSKPLDTTPPAAPPTTPPKPTDTVPVTPPPPVIPNITVDGKWQCEVDGIKYAGNIDTGFFSRKTIYYTSADTLVTFTGTSTDKSANIYFSYTINRATRPATDSRGVFIFDTCSTLKLGYATGYRSNMDLKIDSFVQNRIQGGFYGTVVDIENQGVLHTVTNGKFSFEFNKGTAEEKFFSFDSNESNIGYVKVAEMVTNTLIIDGFPMLGEPARRFKLKVRTGGTIKPGTYKSENGDVAMQHYLSGVYRTAITDTLGQLSVTITVVNGNIVEGFFSGNSAGGMQISNGKFKCRVKNYVPEPDLPYRWKFGINESIYEYAAYAGNMLKAVRTQDAGKYYLTMNGESDHGTSKFKIALSSPTPITAGIYRIQLSPNKIDSMNFSSNTKLWNGNNTYMEMDDYSEGYCRIDSINASEVSGVLYGKIHRRFNSGSISIDDIKKATFSAAF